jgi:hypothetical protein
MVSAQWRPSDLPGGGHVATSHTHHLLAAHASRQVALTSRFGHALLACSLFLVAAAVIAARSASTRSHHMPGPESATAVDAV